MSTLQVSRGNGTSTGTSYAGRLALGYTYVTGNNGNINTQTITVPTLGSTAGSAATRSFPYDGVSRLQTVGEGRTWRQTYCYDAYGQSAVSRTIPTPLLTPTSLSDFCLNR